LRVALFLLGAALAQAQDPFEIHVYEYEKTHLGEYTLEAHLNWSRLIYLVANRSFVWRGLTEL
jgi:hypothetical protein